MAFLKHSGTNFCFGPFLIMTAFFGFLLTLIYSLAAVHCEGEEWSECLGRAEVMSAKGDELWTITHSHAIHRYNGKEFEPQKCGAQVVATGSDGVPFFIWRIVWWKNVYRYTASNKCYASVPGDMQQISVASAKSAVAVDYVTQVWQFENEAWKQLPGRANQAAIGDNNEIWMIDPNNRLYRLVSDAWQLMSQNVMHVEVQNAKRVVMTNMDQAVFKWAGDGQWTQITGKSCVKAYITYDKIYCHDIVGGIYYTKA